METWKALIAPLVVALAIVSLGSCDSGRYVARPNEELYGVWQNENMGEQKVAIAADGFKTFNLTADDKPLYEGKLQIAAKWTDSKGNLCYKAYQTVTSRTAALKETRFQVLYQLGKSGTVLEGVNTPVREFDPSAFPARLDPTNSSYSLYYRGAEHPRRVLIGDMWSEPAQEKTR